MNSQIHVLSAKFIDFNAKLNEHLFVFNRQSFEKVSKEKIIDNDASHFLTSSSSNKKQCERKNKNNFIAHTKSDNRFTQPFNKYECENNSNFAFRNTADNRFRGRSYENHESQAIRVRIEFANFRNLDDFQQKLKAKIEKRIGKQSVLY